MEREGPNEAQRCVAIAGGKHTGSARARERQIEEFELSLGGAQHNAVVQRRVRRWIR
jgi:hypothetical protein